MMDFTNILEVLPTLTDCQMKVIYDNMGEIQRQREEEKRNKLINDFKEAFLALRQANIDIYYTFNDDDEEVSLYDYDGFYFD